MGARKKNTNPLYVVKNGHVEQADSILDLLIKKFNLTPVINLFNALIKMILENVKTYAVFVAVQDFFNLIIEKLKLFRQFSII